LNNYGSGLARISASETDLELQASAAQVL
jgi:hypothetical protein